MKMVSAISVGAKKAAEEAAKINHLAAPRPDEGTLWLLLQRLRAGRFSWHLNQEAADTIERLMAGDAEDVLRAVGNRPSDGTGSSGNDHITKRSVFIPTAP